MIAVSRIRAHLDMMVMMSACHTIHKRRTKGKDTVGGEGGDIGQDVLLVGKKRRKGGEKR
jgi:hypothetical protein